MLDLWQAFHIERSIRAPLVVEYLGLISYRVPSCSLDQHHLCPSWGKKVFEVMLWVVDLMALVVWGFLFVGVFWWGGSRERAVWDILSSAISPVIYGSKNPTLIVVWEEETRSVKVNEKDSHLSHLVTIRKIIMRSEDYLAVWILFKLEFNLFE